MKGFLPVSILIIVVDCGSRPDSWEGPAQSHVACFVSGSIEPGLSEDIWGLFLLETVSVLNFIALTDTSRHYWKKMEKI